MLVAISAVTELGKISRHLILFLICSIRFFAHKFSDLDWGKIQ